MKKCVVKRAVGLLRIRLAQMGCFLLFCASFSGCVSAPPPRWASAPESVYPRRDFLTGRGAGKSRTEAETAAIAEIARVFGVEVYNEIADRQSVSSTNGQNEHSQNEHSQKMSIETWTRAYTELFNLKYAAPWKNPQTKQWEALAYIDREEAWEMYEPRLRPVTASFMEAYNAAGAADDPLSRYSRYLAVRRLGNEEGGAAGMLKYAQALYPEKARAYEAVQNALAGVSAKIQSALDWAVITVRCEGDFENIVTGAIIEAFRRGGFKTAGAGERGTNRAEAAIDEGQELQEGRTFYAPRMTLTVSGEGKTLFTWAVSADRQGARDPAVAKRETWNALGLKIKESLLTEFNASILRINGRGQ